MPSFLVALIPLAVLLATVVVVVVRSRRRRRKPRQGREPSGFVILEGNLWEACAVDDLREPWGRYTTEPVRGFCGVPAGRHRVRTTTTTGEATLDFVIYPGEILCWRLDVEHARWEPHDLDPDTRSSLESAPLSTNDVTGNVRPNKLPGWLVHLRTMMNIGRARSGAAFTRSSDESIDRLRKRLAKLVATAESDSDTGADSLAEARALGESLIGRPLTRKDLRALVSCVRDAATRLTANGHVDRAMRVLSVGLAVLPGDPELMVTMGCALAARGDVDEALRALNAALERDRCLEADDVARAMRARMELRSRLGRSVRV